jgi:hypothetical protein
LIQDIGGLAASSFVKGVHEPQVCGFAESTNTRGRADAQIDRGSQAPKFGAQLELFSLKKKHDENPSRVGSCAFGAAEMRHGSV